MNKLIGNAVIGQSGGPTVAINATLSGVVRGCKECECIKTIYGALYGIEGLLNENFCNLSELLKTEDDHKLLEQTPAAALGSCRKKMPKLGEGKETYDKLLEIFKKYDIRYFFYIGGNDSMDTVYKVSEYMNTQGYEMRVMGVPKTIDCDLCETDHTPGYGSAAKYIATTTKEILADTAVYTVKAVTIIEIMGRDAGWLTCASALPALTGASPDLVYLPEVYFDYDEMYEDIEKAFKKHPNVVIAISEGARLKDGTYVGEGTQSGAVDIFGHKYLSGTGKALEMAIKDHFGCKVRSIELNLPQRCAAHLQSKTDIDESVSIGRYAALTAVNDGETGKMASFVRMEGNEYKITFSTADISKVANAVRQVPREFINERGNNVTKECLEYIAPFIMGECDIKYECGMPKQFEIKK